MILFMKKSEEKVGKFMGLTKISEEKYVIYEMLTIEWDKKNVNNLLGRRREYIIKDW